jgi:hypothetical protein
MFDMAAVDMFVVATATFQLLYGLIVLGHDRRRVIHFEVTLNPTQIWLARQMTEAFPWDTTPRYLVRDRDGSYGQAFRDRVRAMGIKEVVTAARSPWQNAYVERIIGSIRRECPDHVIIFDERHLRGVLSSHFFTIITRPERISRSTRIARRPGLYTDSLQARLLRSQRSLDCTIATSAALRELLRPPNGPPISASKVIPLCPRHKCNAVQNGLGAQVAPAAQMFHSVDENSHPNLHSCPISFLSKDRNECCLFPFGCCALKSGRNEMIARA